jgi:hypothetical protein
MSVPELAVVPRGVFPRYRRPSPALALALVLVLGTLGACVPGCGAAAAVTGTFDIPRNGGASCVAVSAATLPAGSAPPPAGCAEFSWGDLGWSAGRLSNFSAYTDAADGAGYRAYIGAVGVAGAVGGENLTFVCPPDLYNGFNPAKGSYCQVCRVAWRGVASWGMVWRLLVVEAR